MGEGIIVVTINSCSYIIEKGHNNNDQKAIKIALDYREEELKKEEKMYQEQDVRDENGVPIFVNFDIDEIVVSEGKEIKTD
jgi:hypothetical protein